MRSPTVLISFTRSLQRALERLGFRRDWYVIALGAVVGALTGAGAVGFATTLHAAEAASGGFQASHGLWLLPLLPMAGALLTGLLVHVFASDARGHGVPQVIEALARKGGTIPLRVGLVKVAASICTVGSGGSAGAEGPIVQIGATAGSVFARRTGVPREHVRTLVGCGAAAGIASIFNAPMAGVFFVLEIMLRDFSVRTFTPIVVAAVFSAATTQALLGRNEAIFAGAETRAAVMDHSFAWLAESPGYLMLGVVCGLVAVGFSRLLHLGEDLFERTRLHPVVRPVAGALLLGVLGIAFLLVVRAATGEGVTGGGGVPHFFGNGYDTIRWLLDPGAYAAAAGGDGAGSAAAAPRLPAAFWLLGGLALCKAVGTVLTLASGGSGGVFAPSLFLGATTGGAFGVALSHQHLLPAGGPASYALVGMAAVVAGAMHAPLTAMLMLFELTRDAYVLLPVMLAAVVATAVAQVAERDLIYTARLRRSGVRLWTARDATVLGRVPVASVPLTPLPPEPVYPADPLSKLVALHAFHSVPDFAVVDGRGAYVGMVTGSDMRTALVDREAVPLLLVAELLRTDLPTVTPDEQLDSVVSKFASHDVASLAVVPVAGGPPAGLVTRGHVLRRYQEALDAE